MTDIQPQVSSTLPRRTARIILLTVWIIGMVCMLTVIVAALFFSIRYPEATLPAALKSWGDLAMGFLISSLSALVKDLLS